MRMRIALAVLGAVMMTRPILAQPQQEVVLKNEPGSPLFVISMRPTPVPPAAPNMPEWLVKGRAAYDVVVQNQGNVPIMAWSINYLARTDAKLGICASMLSLSQPLLKPGEMKTLHEVLYEPGPAITPWIDLVVLENGSYYGKNSCSTLSEYTHRVGERRAAFQTIMSRLQKDGPDKTMLWLNQELSRDIKPLLDPKKMKTAVE